jgi:signal transduction histidine kinase
VLTVLVVYAILLSLTTFLLTGLADLLRQSEQRLRQANEHLDQLSQQRRDFLRVAMHNLKSPVSAVSMILTNLKNELPGPLNDKQKQMIDRSLYRLAGSNEFLRDVQTLANIESDDLTRQFQPVDLKRLLGELVEENRDLAEQREHELVLQLPDQPLRSPGIERLLREAIANFITNAIKYTPAGGRIVVAAEAGNDRALVMVQDNGVGISEADQKRLFRDFVRIRSEHESVKDAPGSGLGLSIAKRILQAHGGTITVDSQPAQGSTFTIDLPQA